ncbi:MULTISPECIES: 16S rRNA (cytidine(1402)-2'-O)-methyltransferase [Brevibacillus]|uniref:Ribosomal RNA small subunit methyltransferase I n=1 Tax=Brevibacillus invocatus TaxID=173959 RepID=A0A3M8CNW2_9BACL|nr:MULTISPECIES: 16S rRNA (cytidine(1402)-2'-O)-methyltransferase [Brevibacillus]MCM3080152.1 16S rRNA (cytidine(1402)-2'-O)-methyltransferase [Brevibacillus invocatus]MCM3430402.1 16S rRNA (cytidine(1402)-2'-O)-methyltransferase [Brevibacillus invocatus]MDH4619136.1 16S rRNA (cytidine(1402)-2'-O)-methyltransferase [Brevibacillus sp. AY1]RNB77269.1 16S rRNA (cytidine(1402)-2'-O)-methyltransferase [Brevibacillus invocatus]
MNVQSSFTAEGTGVLYLVATPIGNLDDMTVRCLETLRMVDVIACEDTRQTRKLLNHFQIEKRTVSYHEHNKEASGQGLLQWLEEGKRIALVSDAGLPAISDPGAELVRDATAAGFPVIPVPGANAGLTALIASGLPTDRFVFCGFLGRENKERREELERLKHYPETLIFYEAPHRIGKTLTAIRKVWGNRRAVLARELTKRYEEFVRGTLDELIEWLEAGEVRGEFCLIVEGFTGTAEAAAALAWWQDRSLVEHVDQYVEQGLNKKEAIKKAAEDRGVSKRDVYNEYHRE